MNPLRLQEYKELLSNRPIRFSSVCVWTAFVFLTASSLHGAKIGDITDTSWTAQALRFWSFEDAAVRFAVLGTILMGVCCGLLGSFVVVRKLALVGDTVSHAVFPGVALGFLWNMSKDPLAIFIGATLAGLLSTVVVHWIKSTTHIKEDSALGMVLSGFYAVGICLFTMIQQMNTGNQSGLDKFMFGQAAALSPEDVNLMGVVTLLAVSLIGLCYKEFLIASFDSGFARSIGIAYSFFHYLLMVLLAFAVVVSLQATGVVLVSALLIIPAATAYLLTDRLHIMLLLAAVIGALSGVLGAFLSFLGNNLPTGPFMVVSASTLFALAFFCGPRHGWLPRWWRRRSQSSRIQAENTLKAIYQVMEGQSFEHDTISVSDLATRRNVSVADIEGELAAVSALGHVSISEQTGAAVPHLSQDKQVAFTPSGWLRACQIVRNHRLWELYLTHSALYAADHVHDDAEKIEHLLGEETVRMLERHLDNPRRDPHGKLIPTMEDLEKFTHTSPRPEEASGYVRPS